MMAKFETMLIGVIRLFLNRLIAQKNISQADRLRLVHICNILSDISHRIKNKYNPHYFYGSYYE